MITNIKILVQLFLQCYNAFKICIIKSMARSSGIACPDMSYCRSPTVLIESTLIAILSYNVDKMTILKYIKQFQNINILWN